jgi:hypothetical protein
MQRYDLTSPELPSLKINKTRDREIVENEAKVQNLIKTNLLLDKEFINMLLKIQASTKEINKLLEEGIENSERDITDWRWRRPFIHGRRIIFPHSLMRKRRKFTTKEEKELEAKIKKAALEDFKRHNINKKGLITKKSNEILKMIDSFEKERAISPLDILDSIPAYYCPICKSVIGTERFRPIKCKCGAEVKVVNVKTKIIYKFNNNTVSFMDNNLWLENGIDYLFRKMNFSTICGFYILGHSGLDHEIDNIVENRKENLRIFCECKNCMIDRDNIFVFSGKMQDIGCTKGYIFSTSKIDDKKIFHLARARNISIIDSVLDKSIDDMIKEIGYGTKEESQQ